MPGTAPPPPLPGYPYPYYVYTNPPQQYATRVDWVPNGEWKVVCKNYDCGATNKVLPLKTNTVVIEALGGRTVEKWLKLKCPVCECVFSNRFEQVWVPEVAPIPVMVITNLNDTSTNKVDFKLSR